MYSRIRLRGMMTTVVLLGLGVTISRHDAIARDGAAITGPREARSALAGQLFSGLEGSRPPIPDAYVFVLDMDGETVLGHTRVEERSGRDQGRFQITDLPARDKALVVGFSPRMVRNMAIKQVELDGRFQDIGRLETSMVTRSPSPDGAIGGGHPALVLFALAGWVAGEASSAAAERDVDALAARLLTHAAESRPERPREAISGGPVQGQNWTSPSTGMEFVWIPAMKMWVGKYEVTNGEYRKKKPGHDSKSYKGHSLNGDRQPVVYVSFDDAKKYAEWLTERDKAQLDGMRYRLPGEQEWMTYAQCGDGREFPWGNNWPPRSGQAGNYRDMAARQRANLEQPVPRYNDGFAVAAPVEALWRNPWGLHGVGGNVWEACAADSTGQSFGAWRGAGWDSTGRETLRCATRYPYAAEARTYNTGFRLLLAGP